MASGLAGRFAAVTKKVTSYVLVGEKDSNKRPVISGEREGRGERGEEQREERNEEGRPIKGAAFWHIYRRIVLRCQASVAAPIDYRRNDHPLILNSYIEIILQGD
jgi:hypothetical protein